MIKRYLKSFDGAKIYYHKTQKDKKKCLIFLHGLGGDLTAWENERRYFDRLGFSTIAVDLRGHGFSDRSTNKAFYDFKNFAEDVKSIIEQEEISAPILVGHCLGGMVSMYFNNLYPTYSKSLVLIDTSYKIPFFSDHPVCTVFLSSILEKFAAISPQRHIQRHIHFQNFHNTTDLDLRRLLSDILHTSFRSYFLICSNFIEYDATTLLERISVPSLIIEGLKDSIFTPDIAFQLRERIKYSDIELIPKANHILVITAPKEVNTTIEKYLVKIGFL